jgi:hypothetical protein
MVSILQPNDGDSYSLEVACLTSPAGIPFLVKSNVADELIVADKLES